MIKTETFAKEETCHRGLGLLLQLAQKVRQADSRATFGFTAVNETHTLVPYRQAVLWYEKPKGKPQIVALSGLARPDGKAPFVLWLTCLLRHLSKTGPEEDPSTYRAVDLPEKERSSWAEWLPEYVLHVPLLFPGGGPAAGLLLARETPWNTAEQHLLKHLAEIYAHAWESLEWRLRRKGRPWQGGFRRTWLLWLSVLLMLAALALPIRQSVLAPAEVGALHPVVVRASLEGVVDRFYVEPHQLVQVGQKLLSLDGTTLKNRLEMAQKDLSVFSAEYRQAAQKAVFDQESKPRLAILKARIERQEAETNYLKKRLKRLDIHALRAGIILLDDVNDWLGKPVVVGERILVIADPAQVELDIRLPVGDAISLASGAEVSMFLTSSPQQPLAAMLHYVAYKAVPTAEGVLAYRLKARFKAGTPVPRIGLRGTARIFGHRVPLGYYLLRRPLAAMRPFFGY